MSFPIDIQIPNAPNDPADDQPKIKDNFVNIDGFLSVDHVDPGATNNGMHKQTQLVNNGLPPGLIGNTGTLYTDTANSQTQLFYTNGASGNEYQMTRADNTNFSLFATNTNYPNALNPQQLGGWTFLPGGMLLQYGFSNIIAGNSGSTTIPFPIVFNAPLNAGPFSITIGCITNEGGQPSSNNYFILSQTNAQFVMRSSSSGARTLYWMAIGI